MTNTPNQNPLKVRQEPPKVKEPQPVEKASAMRLLGFGGGGGILGGVGVRGSRVLGLRV